MTFAWTRNRVLLAAAFIIVAVLARNTWDHAGDVSAARLPNPDSYYKLVLVGDSRSGGGLQFVARDNVPDGNWVHWSKPHSWSLLQVSRLLAWAGMSRAQSLLWAGAMLTLTSMLLLVVLTALAVTQAGTLRGAIVAALALSTSLPVLAYGGVTQLTHHVFMLVPAALAAAMLFRGASARWGELLLAGASLALALWISPETMPLVVALTGLRAAMRLQLPDSGSLLPVLVGFWGGVMLAWWSDPPPPTFSAWAMDHVSMAWLLFAGLLGMVLLLADRLAARGVRLTLAAPVTALVASAALLVWLLIVPNALRGPSGLIPDELVPLFWNAIDELQPVSSHSDAIGYLLLPALATLLLSRVAWRERSLWLLVLALSVLAYGMLAATHTRMGAASSLLAALAYGLVASREPALADGEQASSRPLDQAMGVLVIFMAVAPMALSMWLEAFDRSGQVGPAVSRAEPIDDDCSLAAVAPVLDELPSATILAPVFSGPELLYRTSHRIISGPYHHNINGIRDSYRAWLDARGGEAWRIVRQRGISYVLGCQHMQVQLIGRDGARTLAQRVADGDVPAWLQPVPWPRGMVTNWRLYRVRLASDMEGSDR